MFRVIWSPWRYEYIKTFTKGGKEECILCKLHTLSDKDAYIVYRGRYNYIVLNAYPYNSGHVMIVPYRHVDSLEKLNSKELEEMMELARRTIMVMKEALKPDGINVGINIGRAAGAGIEEHVHMHIVPRWCGDSNFMPVVARIKSLPIALEETYNLLKKQWSKLEL